MSQIYSIFIIYNSYGILFHDTLELKRGRTVCLSIYGMIFSKIYIVATKINVALKFLDLSAKYSIFLIKTKKYCYSYLSLLNECIFFFSYVC